MIHKERHASIYSIGLCAAFSLALYISTPVQALEASPKTTDIRYATSAPKPDSSVLSQAQSYIRDRKHKQAYQLLKPHETKWAGNPDFDYLFGVAALDSGKSEDAVFILQRVVAVNPNHPAARMELARAYYEAGDYTASQREFERLRGANPPDFAQKVIGDYLSAIQKRNETRAQDSSGGLGGYFELGAGYDSNANGATERDQFLGFTLAQQNRKTDAYFGQLAMGGQYTAQVHNELQASLAANLHHRWNSDAEFVNFDRFDVGTGLKWRHQVTEVYGGVNYFQTNLDSDAPFSGALNHRGAALDLGTAYQFTDATRVSADFRVGAIRYEKSQNVRDVNQFVAALTSVFQITGPGRPIFGLSGIMGVDDAVQKGSPFGRSLFGGRATVSWTALERVQGNIQGGILHSAYEGRFFGIDRKDTQYIAGTSADISTPWANSFQISPYVLYVSNSSNVSLFKYDRTEVGMNLRFNFR